jgi:hypothetical protein
LYKDDQGKVQCRTSTFSDALGSRTIADILDALESGKKVIVDTSRFTDEIELLIGSILLTEVFNNYRKYKLDGQLEQKPVISIIVEEAPRVLNQDVARANLLISLRLDKNEGETKRDFEERVLKNSLHLLGLEAKK